MELIALVVSGGIAGWIAGKLLRGRGQGLVINVALGVTGGIIGAKLLAPFGIAPHGWPEQLAMAVLGAILLLSIIGLIRGRRRCSE